MFPYPKDELTIEAGLKLLHTWEDTLINLGNSLIKKNYANELIFNPKRLNRPKPCISAAQKCI